tara:strand:- start:550 stop:1374 length:825 start_codon:yes stop_codon:yes gene_type:complete
MTKLYLLGDIGDYSKKLNNLLKKIKQNIKQDDLIIILGDNFYPVGINDINDIQVDNFKKSFDIFNNDIYMILGNHDYILNPSCQINSPYWKMKNWYYSINYYNYTLYFLDTVQLFPSEHIDGTRIKKTHNDYLDNLYNKQLLWFENELKENKNKNKLVFGHYPIISNGDYYYDFVKLYNRLFPLFRKYNVKAYFSGHEHNFQFIKRNFDNYTFYQFICGNSGDVRKNTVKYDRINFKEDIFYNETCCYIEVDISESKLKISVHDNNDELYNYYI